MISSAWAAEGAPAVQQPSMFQFLFPFLAIGLIFYFLLIRPESKKAKEREKMLAALKKGDRVLTSGGLYGTVLAIQEKEQVVVLKIAENVKVEVSRPSVTIVKAEGPVSGGINS